MEPLAKFLASSRPAAETIATRKRSADDALESHSQEDPLATKVLKLKSYGHLKLKRCGTNSQADGRHVCDLS